MKYIELILYQILHLLYHFDYSIVEGIFYYYISLLSGPSILKIVSYGIFSLLFKWCIYPGYAKMAADFDPESGCTPISQLIITNIFLIFLNFFIVAILDLDVYMNPNPKNQTPLNVFSDILPTGNIEYSEYEKQLVIDDIKNEQDKKLENYTKKFFIAQICFGVFIWLISID